MELFHINTFVVHVTGREISASYFKPRTCFMGPAEASHCFYSHRHKLLGPCRLVLWSGLDAGSVVLFDSGRGGQIPFEGVISEGPAVRIQFITDQPNHNTGFNIRYEGTDFRSNETQIKTRSLSEMLPSACSRVRLATPNPC